MNVDPILVKINHDPMRRYKQMPNLSWPNLTNLQLGQYVEHYAKMKFMSYGYEVYTSELDDHGVDFVAKNPDDKREKKYYDKLKKKSQDLEDFLVKSEGEMEQDDFVKFTNEMDNKIEDIYQAIMDEYSGMRKR